MADNLSYWNIIRVGFLNTPVDVDPVTKENMEKLSSYMDKYDVVIANDGSFKTLNKWLVKIIDQEYKDYHRKKKERQEKKSRGLKVSTDEDFSD